MKFTKLRGSLLRPPLILAYSSVLFAGMFLLVKAATKTVPGMESAFVRFAFCTLVCLWPRVWRNIKYIKKSALIRRGIFGGFAVSLYYLAIGKLPLGTAMVIYATGPVIAAVYARIFLKELLSAKAIAGLLISSVGVSLVILGGQANAGANGSAEWYGVCVLAAMFSGAAIGTAREACKHDGLWEIFSSFSFGGAGISLMFGAFMGGWVWPNQTAWGLLLLAAVVSIAGQMLMTHAFREVSVALGGTIKQIEPLLGSVAATLLFSEKMSALSKTGAVLTLGGVVLGAFGSKRAAKFVEPQ